MSTKTTHRDAVDAASTQVSLGEVLSDFDAEEPEPEPEPEPDNDAGGAVSTQVTIGEVLSDFDAKELDKITVGESSIDYSQTVFASKDGNRYHAVQAGGIPGCPDIDAEQTTLATAVVNGLSPCQRCDPIDHREDEEKHTTEGQ